MISAKIAVFVKGFAFFIVGIMLAASELPSDPTGAVVYAGNEIMDSMENVSDSSEVARVADSTRESLLILGVGSTIIGFLEMVGALFLLFR